MITLLLLHPLKRTPVQVWPFENESVIRIGRSTDNHVILYSAVVSRHHVELRQVGGGWEIENLGTNGTYLDGKRITKVPVTDGAIIRLARSGPNIQIRIGTEALNDLPESLKGDRTNNSRPDLQPTETEVTDPLNNRFGLSNSGTPADANRNEHDLQPGTIPVPPHLRLPAETFAEGLAIVSNAVSKRRSPSSSAIPSTPSPPVSLGSPRYRRSRSRLAREHNDYSLQTIGDYQILQVLGQGDIGVTYLARRDQKQVVLKTLTFEWIQHPKAQAALEFEADILRQIYHPKIPQLVDCFSIGDRPYLAMEMMPGESLARHVTPTRPVSVKMAIGWMIELCQILDYLHSFNPPILHRNLEPANILCQTHAPAAEGIAAESVTWHESSTLSLVGFGTAKALILGQQSHVGTTGYSSPAQLDINASPDVDLYSLGPTFAYMLTGHHPVSFCSDGVQGQQFCVDRISGISPSVRAMIRNLTHPDPEQRYPTAAAAANAFAQLAASL